MAIVPESPDRTPPPIEGLASRCPVCGNEASQLTTRDLAEHAHEVTGSCKLGHLWVTKWFAADPAPVA